MYLYDLVQRHCKLVISFCLFGIALALKDFLTGKLSHMATAIFNSPAASNEDIDAVLLCLAQILFRNSF
jgi:hypothetical protein